MRRILATFTCLSALVAFVPAQAGAQGNQEQAYLTQPSPAADIPLVVIRFNQNKVLFEHQLYNAIAKAVEIKPTVVMDVVSFVPQTGNSRTDETIARQASSETATVVNSLRNMGIPQERMHVSQETASGLRYHEVHVYVE